MSDLEWCVILNTHDRQDGLPSEGNLASALVYGVGGEVNANTASVMLRYFQTVFTKGELLVVEPDYHREQMGQGRNPGKWTVTCEHFALDKYEEAIARAREVSSA